MKDMQQSTTQDGFDADLFENASDLVLRCINDFCGLPSSHKPQMQGNQMGVWGVVLALEELVLFCFRAIGVCVCLQKSAAYSFANIGQHE